jgi:NADH-quinone oxidoreductase subunit E
MEIATFYTMFNLNPVGAHHFQICGTTPCMLSGSEKLKSLLREEIGEQNSVSKDNLSWVEVECLGACCNAPVIQINDDYYEDLAVTDLKNIIDDLRSKKEIKPGSYKDRLSSAPDNKNIKILTEDEIEEIAKNRTKPGLEGKNA